MREINLHGKSKIDHFLAHNTWPTVYLYLIAKKNYCPIIHRIGLTKGVISIKFRYLRPENWPRTQRIRPCTIHIKEEREDLFMGCSSTQCKSPYLTFSLQKGASLGCMACKWSLRSDCRHRESVVSHHKKIKFLSEYFSVRYWMSSQAMDIHQFLFPVWRHSSKFYLSPFYSQKEQPSL